MGLTDAVRPFGSANADRQREHANNRAAMLAIAGLAVGGPSTPAPAAPYIS